jgi:hypothetical protein
VEWFICVITAAFVCVSNYMNCARRLSFSLMKWNGPNSPNMQAETLLYEAPNS